MKKLGLIITAPYDERVNTALMFCDLSKMRDFPAKRKPPAAIRRFPSKKGGGS